MKTITKQARLIFIYTDFDLSSCVVETRDVDALVSQINEYQVLMFLVGINLYRRNPILVYPEHIHLDTVQLSTILNNDCCCKVEIEYDQQRKFDGNGECLKCDAFSEYCECFSVKLNQYVQVNIIV